MALRPLTAEEFLDRCDLAGVARVVSVGRATPTSPNLAKLEFIEFHKGNVPDGKEGARQAFVRLHGGAGAADGRPALGGWSDWWDYPAGDTVVTHLDWNEKDGCYETTSPGAVWEVRDAAA